MDEKEQIHEKPLLWSRSEVAVQLGISDRKVDELIQEGALPSMSIGRRVLVPRQAVLDWVKDQTRYNSRCAGSVVQEKSTCHISASKREVKASSGGYRSPMQTANELESLLEQRKRGKP